MLTGHESLLRIIGKRRRLLPDRHSILSNISCQEETKKKGSVEKISNDGVFVNCPVCDIQLDNTLINSHLDKCLARGGSKRKLGQLTLFQLNFSRTKLKQTTLDSTNTSFSNTYESKDYDDNNNHSTGILPVTVKSPILLETLNPGNNVKEIDYDDDISTFMISTFIVGRRFCSKYDLNFESRIRLSRDPENNKDINAIKVLFAETEHDNSLGYLPKELAQYLSPLIDTFGLNFEARITSLPKSTTAAIPIHIECKNMLPCDEKHSDKMKLFKSLQRHAQHAADLATTGPSGMTRYQQNLVLIIEEILKNYSHIFTSSEKSFLESFLSLPDERQRLFARLYTRKGPWFRLSKVSYPEIADCNQAVKGLIELGYLVSFPWEKELESDAFKEVLDVLNIDELREAAGMLKMKCHYGSLKHDIISLLLSSCTGRHLCPKLQLFFLNTTKSCVQISPLAASMLWRTERLFFLNGEQDLSAFLLLDMGIVTYPAYKCMISEHIFPHRSDLLSYEEAIEIAQIMDESLSKNNLDTIFRCIDISVSRLSLSSKEAETSTRANVATFLSCFSASWVYSKVVLLGVSFLEHEKRYNEATNLLRQLLNSYTSDGRRGYWTLRLSVDLEHLGRLDDSLRVAEDALLDPWVRAGSRVALQRRILRLGKPPRRWKIPKFSMSVKRKIHEVNVQGRPLNCKVGMKSIFYGEDGEQCSVEQLALQYYAGGGGCWQGVHTESGIWLTLFGLLMWDVLFADVPNVFRTRFQTAPLDLDTDSFYEVRKELIEEVLNSIQEGMAEEILVTSWESHFGVACRGVNWDKLSLTELRTAVICIGGHCLASILRHLAQGYRSWSSGMPDLVLWRLHHDKDDCYNHRGEAKLVEVKGPRDRLSEQQRAWLLVLMDCGFNVEICKVTPTPQVEETQ